MTSTRAGTSGTLPIDSCHRIGSTGTRMSVTQTGDTLARPWLLRSARPAAAGDAGGHPARIAAPAAARAGDGERATTVGASSRYTPPVPQSAKESPPWVPVLMLVLFAVGALAIMLRYLVFSDSNWPMIVGLACLLGGLYTATKWR